MRTKITLAVVCAGLLLMECVNATGGSTETSSKIASMLYNPGGSPAVGVTVYIRPDSVLADTSLGLPATAGTDSTVTDNNGNYSFDTSLDAGTYVIEAASGNNAVLIDSVVVSAGPTPDTLPPDTLKPAGAIKGVVYLSEGGDPRKVFVLAFGIDRFTSVNADGSFRFSALARGNYNLRLISSLDDYDVLDTVGVPVLTADTTDLGTIELPYNGIPTPRGLQIQYDTMMQIVTLTWNIPTTGRPIQSYTVYRKHSDSASFVSIKAGVTDTSYCDSTGVQDQTYEYRVAVVDTQNTTGVMSSGISLTVVSAFTIVDSIANGSGTNDGQFGYLVHAAMDSSENFYIVDTKNKWLQKIDSAGQFIFKFVSLQYPRGITIDNLNDVLYISDSQRRLIIKLTLSGDTLLSWQPVNAPGGIIYHAGKLYVSLPDTGIQVYDSVGTEIAFYNYQFKRHNSDNINFCLDSNGKMYVADAENILELDTSSGILAPIYSIINFDQNQDPDIEFVDGNTIILATRGAPVPYQSRLYFIDKNTGVQKGIWKSNEAITDMVYSTIQHRMFVFTGSGKILFCQLNL